MIFGMVSENMNKRILKLIYIIVMFVVGIVLLSTISDLNTLFYVGLILSIIFVHEIGHWVGVRMFGHKGRLKNFYFLGFQIAGFSLQQMKLKQFIVVLLLGILFGVVYGGLVLGYMGLLFGVLVSIADIYSLMVLNYYAMKNGYSIRYVDLKSFNLKDIKHIQENYE